MGEHSGSALVQLNSVCVSVWISVCVYVCVLCICMWCVCARVYVYVCLVDIHVFGELERASEVCL